MRGDLVGCAARLGEVVDECIAANDLAEALAASTTRTYTLAYLGDVPMRGHWRLRIWNAHPSPLSTTSGMPTQLWQRSTCQQAMRPQLGKHMKPARERTGLDPMTSGIHTWAPLAPLACGDVAAARRWADDVVSVNTAWSLAASLTSRSRV